MDCGMGTALGTAHLIAAFEEEQKVYYRKLNFLECHNIQSFLYVFFNIYTFLIYHFYRQLYFLLWVNTFTKPYLPT